MLIEFVRKARSIMHENPRHLEVLPLSPRTNTPAMSSQVPSMIHIIPFFTILRQTSLYGAAYTYYASVLPIYHKISLIALGS